jgi:hypothetical protein
VELKQKTGIDKELTPKTLRHTHVVRAYKKGEDLDSIFERIALAPDSRQEAEEMYKWLQGGGYNLSKVKKIANLFEYHF